MKNKVFITSYPLTSDYSEINNINGLADQLKNYQAKPLDNFVFIASDPTGFEKTDIYSKSYFEAFAKSGLNFKNLVILDDRTKKDIKKIIKDASLVVLTGGSLPVENKFFNDINLKDALKDYDGSIIGVSAGSMNLAEKVVDFPEDDEGIENPTPTYLKGLGYTDINIVPHYTKDEKMYVTEKGIDCWKEFVLALSDKNLLYVLPDGTHVLQEEEGATVCGEAYILKNRKMTQFCEDKKTFKIK